jgi:AcrR family transcriptional regulator
MEPRARRSHAERTAETRSKILEATVESITEIGLSRTTAAEITARAGVTWGAVQHHFGDKDGILVAVVEVSFEHFAELIADIPVDGTSLEKRAALFVERAWEHFSSPHYRSTFEILLGYQGEQRDPDQDWRGRMFAQWDREWQRLFADAELPRHRRYALQHFTISALMGLAATMFLGNAETRLRDLELGMLVDTLVRELRAGG